jgi:hypothetical protein
MYNSEGMAGFYRGCLPTVGLVAFLRSVTFYSYHRTREQILHGLFPLAGEDPNRQSEDIPVGPTWTRPYYQLALTSFGGGFVAGFFQSAINTPMELVKIGRQLERVLEEEGSAFRAKMKGAAQVGYGAGVQGSGGVAMVPEPKKGPAAQVPGSTRQIHTGTGAEQPKPSLKDRLFGRHSSFGTAKRIYSRAGVPGLYTGLSLHMLRDTFGTGFYWLSYETFKHLAMVNLPEGSPFLGAPLHLSAGGLAGITTWAITYPVDVVKSVVQKSALLQFMSKGGLGLKDRKTALGVISKRWRVDGIRGFYFGIGATMLRAAPIHSLNFLVYEKVLEVLGQLR